MAIYRKYPDYILSISLLLIASLIYLPFLGSYPLWDPWEPHYTQVAWEMGNHGTWFNPYYRNHDNWWSKPIMLLWMLRLSLGLFWDHVNDFANHEFAARLPFALAAIVGGVVHYHWVSKLFGRRVGFIAGIILITTPQYLVMGRQVMIDVPHVILYSASIGYLAVGLFTVHGAKRWPWACFWVLQALAVLSKGFVAPVLAILILVGYGIATYVPRRTTDGGAIKGIQAFGAHAWKLLLRTRAHWGLALFFVVGAPWFIYMSFKHGTRYWEEWIFYHHLGRAAGTIDKPAHTFEYYIRHIFIGLLPWAGFLVAALFRFVPTLSPHTTAGRRNLYLFMASIMPFLFFSLSGTKFSHYIFPLMPFLGLIIAVVLDDLLPKASTLLGRPALVETDEKEPQEVEVAAPPDARFKGLTVFVAISLITFGIVAHDSVLDFRHFLRLFLYYHSRSTPSAYFPFIALQVIYFPVGFAIAFSLYSKRFAMWQLVVVGMMAIGLSGYLSWRTMPAMESTYSFKPFLQAYEDQAKPGEPIAQYNSWQQPVRSVIFLFQNRCQHIKNENQVKNFLRRPGRKFILVDRNRLAELRRIARDIGKKLYIVFDGHPYGRMVSDEANPDDMQRMEGNVMKEAPSDIQRNGANFEDKIEFLGFKLSQQSVKPGESIEVSYYFKALSLMDKDWQIFIHGDSNRGAGGRLHLDHHPLDGLYLTTEWQELEVIRDTFTVEIPADYKYDNLILWTGFYQGNRRLKVRPGVSTDGDNRVRGPQIRIDRE